MRSQPLFPRLRILSIPLSDILRSVPCTDSAQFPAETHLQYLTPFFVPTLTRVNVEGHRHKSCPLYHLLLTTLSVTNPSLRHLRSAELDSQIIELLPRFQQLKMFDSSYNTSAASRWYTDKTPSTTYAQMLRIIPALSGLSTLLLGIENPNKILFSPTSLAPIFNLTRIALKVHRCSYIASMFPLMPNLEKIAISAARLSPDDLKTLSLELRSCPLLRNLQIFACLAHPNVKVIVIDHVRPLKGLNLEILILDFFYPTEIEISCGAVCEIGSSFPALQKLHLFPSCNNSGESWISHADTGMAIAKLCPELVEFKFSRTRFWN
jgi:hypothetical protein